MNLKTIGLNAAVATALVAGSSLSISPAQAATVGSRLDFLWFGKIDTLTPKVDFLNLDTSSGATTGQFVVAGTSTGSFTGLGTGTIKDLGVPEFLGLVPGGSGVSNFLTAGSETFKLTKLTAFTGSIISFKGLFGNGAQGLGTFTVLGGSPDFFSYKGSVTAVAVPTPALLPGLLAMGIGILRKRKAEVSEKIEA
jgi:hypothetical protein